MAKPRLSSKAMNNVVIFAMLFMIVLFNLETFLPTSPAPQSRPLIAPNAYLLRIEQDNFKLERAGQGWRQSQLTQSTAVTPSQQVQAWQEGYLVPTSSAPTGLTSDSAYIVVVWLAGQTEGQVYAFYPLPETTLVLVNEQWFELQGASLARLLPWNSPNH